MVLNPPLNTEKLTESVIWSAPFNTSESAGFNMTTLIFELITALFDVNVAWSRKMIDAGLPLALATDYNPGSTPSGNMNFVISTACIKMKMTPEEAINAATINGAYAMGLEKTHGSICKGKKANFIISKKIPGYHFIPYSFGNNQIDIVYISGEKI